MDHVSLLFAILGLFSAGIIKGATGLGYASCALPFVVTAVGLEPAMAVVMGPTVVTCLIIAWSGSGMTTVVRSYSILFCGMIAGVAGGIGLLQIIDKSHATAALGIVMVLYGCFALIHPAMHLSSATAKFLQLPVGFANGVVAGLTGSQVMPLVPYVLALDVETKTSVQIINLAVLGGALAVAGGLLVVGTMTPALAAGAVLAVIPALMGLWIGNKVRAYLPVRGFRTLVLIILMWLGLALLLK